MKTRALIVGISTLGCHTPPKAAPVQPPAAVVRVVVLPAESDLFPKTAQALTDSLAKAHVTGAGETQLSKVSLEVVQLSIECVEPTPSCYQAVGKSLSANRLLFAEITPGGQKQIKVTVTLFDVDAREPKQTEKFFPNEKAATAAVAQLVEEATR